MPDELSALQARVTLGVSLRTLNRYRIAGKVSARFDGSRWHYDKASIEAFQKIGQPRRGLTSKEIFQQVRREFAVQQ